MTGEDGAIAFTDAWSEYFQSLTVEEKRGSDGKRARVPAKEIREWGKTLSKENQDILFPSENGALRKQAIEAYNEVHGTTY